MATSVIDKLTNAPNRNK